MEQRSSRDIPRIEDCDRIDVHRIAGDEDPGAGVADLPDERPGRLDMDGSDVGAFGFPRGYSRRSARSSSLPLSRRCVADLP